MSKIKNKYHRSTDPERLKELAEEVDKYLGREYYLNLKEGYLVVFALPRKHKKSSVTKEERDKRKEKFARREK